MRVTHYDYPFCSEVSFSVNLDRTLGLQNSIKNRGFKSHPKNCCLGPTEIWTRIAGFRVQSANHYTMGPYSFSVKENYQVEPLIATDFFIADLDLRSGSTDLYKDFVQNIEWKLDQNDWQA